MAVDINLSNITNLTTLSTINNNFTRIENAFENALGLDGDTPNSMRSDLDLNSNDILNAGRVSAQNLTINGIDITDSLAASVEAAQLAETNAELAETNAEVAEAGAEAAQIIAEGARDAALAALSSIIQVEFSTIASAEAYSPEVAPDFIRTAGYTSAGDGGGALYKKVASEPSHAGKFSITLDDAVTVVWYELTSPIVSPQMLGATTDGTVCTSEIQAAINLGREVWLPPGTYDIDALIYPAVNGQKITGAGQDVTIIRNATNDEPLFCFGNPEDADGAIQFSVVSDLTFQGNGAGNTLWGIYCPNASLVDGMPNTSGQYEGVSTSSNSFYYGRTSLAFADWTIAARGNTIRNISVLDVDGGYALHVSAWGFNSDGLIRLWSGKQGLRNSGAANGNRYSGLYISGMEYEGIVHPDRGSSIPTATVYINPIVQQCGLDEATSSGSIALLKGQGTTIISPYLERNNERGGTTDIFVGVSEIGCIVDGVRHRADTTPLQTIIETRGQGTRIGSVTYASALDQIVKVSGSDSRTETVILGPFQGVGSPALTNGEIVHTGTAQKTSVLRAENVDWGFALNPNFRLYKSGSKYALRAVGSTSRVLQLESSGVMRFVNDVLNATGSGNFEFYHNGEDNLGTLLLRLAASNGALTPGANGTQPLGAATARWDTGFMNALAITDGISAPSAPSGMAILYVDSADGDLKVKFADGTVKTIVVDT